MGSITLVSVQEYLTTDYSPDCDYVDGTLEDRNVGEHDHARLQTLLGLFLALLENKLNIHVLTDPRVQVSPTRFRVPDVCVLLGASRDPIITKPPFLCVEVLSPEDRMQRVEKKIKDYLDMGVSYVWIIDPAERRAWSYTRDTIQEAKDGMLRTADPAIEMNLPELFARL